MNLERKTKFGISRVVLVVIAVLVILIIAGAAVISMKASTTTTATSTYSSSSTATQISMSSALSTSSTPISATTASTPTTSYTSTSSTPMVTTTSSNSTSTTPATSLSSSSTTTTISQSQASSSATTQTSSCYVETSSNSSVGQALVGFFSAYSSMSFGFQGSKDGVQKDLNLSYTVVSQSSTTYEVNIDYTLNGNTKAGTIWIVNNGTILAGELDGKNYTGATASTFVLDAFSDLDTIYNLALQSSTIPAYFHSVGTSTVTIGTNSFTVSDYVANMTPETIQGCSGSSAVVNTYNVYLGTPTGSSLELVTSANFSVALTTSSGTTTLDYEYQITALSVA